MPFSLVPAVLSEVSGSCVRCCSLAAFHAPDQVVRVRRYPSDLTDAQWAVLEPLLPAAAWLSGRGGRPEKHCRRVMIDAVLYVLDNGIKWRALPVDFPVWTCVYAWFARFALDWRLGGLVDGLRRAVRVAAGRHPEPSAAAIDSQSVKAAETVTGDQRGVDGFKKVSGRKRHIVVDTLGLLLAVLAGPANASDTVIGVRLLTELAWRVPSVGTVFADGGYIGLPGRTGARIGTEVVVTHRPEGQTGGFAPKRWVVERTLAWTCQRRRCVRDYERLDWHHEAWVMWAAVWTMTRKLARHVKDS